MRALVLTAAAWIAAAAATAGAMQIDMPLPKIIADSDVIVIGVVTDAGKAEQLELQPPGLKTPRKMWSQAHTLTVNETLRDTTGALTPKKAGEAEKAGKADPAAREAQPKPVQIRVLAPADDPTRQPGFIMADGPAYPNLQRGKTYALVLKSCKVKDKADYWLPAYYKNFYRVKKAPPDKRLARLRALADVNAWPWGEAVDGLQVALVPERTTARVLTTRDGRGARVRGARLACTAVLRNAGKKPMMVNLYPADPFLSVTCRLADGQLRECPLVGGTRRPTPAFDAAKHLHRLAPGEMVFVVPHGVSQYSYVQVGLPPEPGKLRLTLDYRSSRKVEGEDRDPPLWRGTAASKPTAVKVVDPQARLPVPEIQIAPGPE